MALPIIAAAIGHGTIIATYSAGPKASASAATARVKAEEESASLASPIRSLVAVGDRAVSRSALLPEAICRTVDREPGITARTVEGPVETPIDGPKSGAIAPVIGTAPQRFEDDEIAVEPLVADGLGIFMRRRHPLADRPAVVGLANRAAIPRRTIDLMRRGRATAAVARSLEMLRGTVDDLPGTATGL